MPDALALGTSEPRQPGGPFWKVLSVPKLSPQWQWTRGAKSPLSMDKLCDHNCLKHLKCLLFHV